MQIQHNKQGSVIRLIKTFTYLILSLSFIYLTFFNLGNTSVENWDEARHGISAYEMIENNNYIVNTFNYSSDFWNLKPPLSFWTEALSFLTMGYNLFAFRISSAISFCLIFAIIAVFLHKNYGFISAVVFMILFQSFGDLIYVHFGRSGDADALFNLFFVLSVILLYYENKIKNNICLYFSGLMFSLAFLSKSFHAATIFLIIVCYIIFSKIFKRLKLKNYFVFLTFSFLPIIIWGIIRFIYDGFSFIGIMFGVDVTDRISESSSDGNNFMFLLKYIFSYKPCLILILLIAASLIILIVCKQISFKSFLSNNSILYILWFIIPFLILNVTSSIMSWYFYPTFISLMVICSILVKKSIVTIFNRKKGSVKYAMIISYGLCILVFAVFIIRAYSNNIIYISNLTVNTEQTALQTLIDRNSRYSGLDTYILKDNNSYRSNNQWEQADILVAELYGNLKCYDGGIEKFCTDDNSLLFVSKSQLKSNKLTLSEFVKINENNDYTVLYNP